MPVEVGFPQRVRQWAWWLTDARYRRQARAVSALRSRKWRASRALWPQVQGRVATGPFAGMRYLPPARLSPLTPKIVGTYEKELWSAIERICGTPYELVVDIGAAEGFYACGLAMQLPQAMVVAFEAEAPLHERIRALLATNGVSERVRIEGACGAETLQTTLSTDARVLVVCDIDGGEDAVLDPESVPALAGADVLAEVHDDLVPGISARVAGRFEPTHDIEVVPRRIRTPADWPPGLALEPGLAASAMDEQRPDGNFWLWMTTRRPAAPRGSRREKSAS